MRVNIVTFGCQMNVHDSERMAGLLAAEGYETTDREDEADVIILNTCSVREKADQKFLSELGRLRDFKAGRPGATIVVAGCVAEQAGDRLRRRFPHIDVIVGTRNLDRLPELMRSERRKRTAVGDNPEYHLKAIPSRRTSWPRAWVSIMYGCDNFCTYCIVPFARGREKSRPPEDILAEVRGLVGEGYREVTLLGQNVNSYGKGIGLCFPDLLQAVHDVDGLERLRFVTSHPKDLSDELIGAMGRLERVCHHLHLPLQSGSDSVLQAMNRRYTLAHYKGRVRKLRETVPDIALTTDLIVGFPGETEDDFAETFAAVREIAYDGVFAFKYSPRPHTKAAAIEDSVPAAVKQERLSRILVEQDRITLRRNMLLEGRDVKVLVEGENAGGRGGLTGRTSTNKLVHFDGGKELIGEMVTVRIDKAQTHSLLGKAAGAEAPGDRAETAKRAPARGKGL